MSLVACRPMHTVFIQLRLSDVAQHFITLVGKQLERLLMSSTRQWGLGASLVVQLEPGSWT